MALLLYWVPLQQKLKILILDILGSRVPLPVIQLAPVVLKFLGVAASLVQSLGRVHRVLKHLRLYADVQVPVLMCEALVVFDISLRLKKTGPVII